MGKKFYMDKLARLIILILIAASVTACQNVNDKTFSKKAFLAITTDNIQGLKEVFRESEINLEKLPFFDSTEFGEKDRRALGIALSSRADYEIVEMLIKNGADVNSVLKNGETYLSYVIINNDLELCELLLKSGADIEKKNSDGLRPMEVLFGSAQHEDAKVSETDLWDMANLLMKYGATITEETLDVYIEAGGFSCVKDMIRYIEQEELERNFSEDVLYALTGENEKMLQYLAKHSPTDEEIVLKYAAANCNVDVLMKLKEYGCDMKMVDEYGQNLLHIAAKYNETSVIDYLLKEGIDKNDCTDFYQWNAATMSVIGGNEENMKFLLKEGVELQSDGAEGVDTWIAACMAGTEKPLKILMNHGFIPTKEEIVYGYENCNQYTIDVLLDNNISYNEEWDEETGFTFLCSINPELAKKIFVDNDNIKVTPKVLEGVIESGDSSFAMSVIDAANDVNVYYTESPLETAIINGEFEIVKYLVETGADINCYIGNDEKYTAMHVAAENASIDILQYLIQQGGDIEISDSDGLKPIDRAKQVELKENIEILSE